MATNLHIRDVPDPVHQTLVRRAAARGMSLRQYAIEVLAEHCALPTMEEWLADLTRHPSAAGPVSGAEAVRWAREEDDAEIAVGHRGG